MGSNQGDLSIHIERVLCETFLQPGMYWPKMRIEKSRKLGVRSKIFLFSNTVQDCGKAVGQAGHSLSMRKLQSLWFKSSDRW